MAQGQIILLNGTSSAGKTTIAKALQESLELPYLHTGIDHFLAAVPKRLFVYVDADDANSTLANIEGWRLPFRDGALVERPRLGAVAYRLLDSMYVAFAALAAMGVNLIVDDVIWNPQVLQAAVTRLAGRKVFFVGLHCPVAEAMRREQARGDRAPGGAAIFHELVHQHDIYDLELDTALLSTAEVVEQIRCALQQPHPQPAFGRLRDQQLMK